METSGTSSYNNAAKHGFGVLPGSSKQTAIQIKTNIERKTPAPPGTMLKVMVKEGLEPKCFFFFEGLQAQTSIPTLIWGIRGCKDNFLAGM